MKKETIKTIIIGVLVLVILGLAGYLASRKKEPIQVAGQVIELPSGEIETKEMLKDLIRKNDSLLSKNLQLKDQVSYYAKVNTELKLTNIRTPLTDTVYTTRTITKVVEKEVIKEVPVEIQETARAFNYRDEALSMQGRVTKTEFILDTLSFKNDISLAVVSRKPKGLFGFLKRRKSVVIATSSDPRVQLTGITSLEVKTPPNNNFIKGFGVGVGVGAIGTALIK